jgi:hypothetical protein
MWGKPAARPRGELISDVATRAQADRNAKALGQITTATINKESSDTERRAPDAAIDALICAASLMISTGRKL